MMTIRAVLAAGLLTGVHAVPAQAQAAGGDSPSLPDTAYVAGEYRVYTGAGEPSSIDAIVTAMARHDVVFVGETHDDPTGHMLEALLLRQAHETHAGPAAAGDASRTVALSLEFFQRDVQPILDEYLSGLITEEMFLADSRPWPRYETDYRPLIEFSKQNGIDVIAANAPRRYTRRVTLHGRESLNDLDARARSTIAPLPYGEPTEAYRNQWIEVISGVIEQEGTKCGRPIPRDEDGEPAAAHATAPAGSHDNMGNQLHSQVLWDATMAHSISEYLAGRPDALVLHMVGGFHVARGTGTPEHLASYRPESSSMIVMLRPVDDVATFEPAPAGEWGDFVVQTDASRTLERIECRAYLSELDSR
ncbi:MAG: ChaN family lipoprotein [Gemmatimonadota bacterium]|nr:ChaN family lipoprotein [Gemmatimonadota bacterium]